jgi:hypothetical protein
MIKAIILDDGYHSKDVIVKFGQNYMCVSLSYFLNSLCKRHLADYEVRTAHLEDIESECAVSCFESLDNMSLHAPAIQNCEEFEALWESDELVDGIDLY